MALTWISPTTLTELTLLGLAFLFTALIGLERQHRLKAAGFRTHALVGIGSALFTLVSAYGFGATTSADIPIDPSRVAAQVVSGVGFLGAGVIFVKRSSISGLTTAASIWVTAAVGMACGANLPTLAAATTTLYLLAVGPLGRLMHTFFAMPKEEQLILHYSEGSGALRSTLGLAVELGFNAVLSTTASLGREGETSYHEATILLTSPPKTPTKPLLDKIATLTGVLAVRVAGLEMD